MLGQPSPSDYAALPGRLYRPRRAPAPSELTRTYHRTNDRPHSLPAQSLEGSNEPELGLGNVPSEPGDQGPESTFSSKVLGLGRRHWADLFIEFLRNLGKLGPEGAPTS
jgi:hypothetical protein